MCSVCGSETCGIANNSQGGDFDLWRDLAVGEDGQGVQRALAETAQGQWYVLHTYSGYENKVRHNLEQRIETMGMKDKIFDVVIPTQEEIEVRDGKRRTVERHIFPG